MHWLAGGRRDDKSGHGTPLGGRRQDVHRLAGGGEVSTVFSGWPEEADALGNLLTPCLLLSQRIVLNRSGNQGP
jgi:hypothetical protein